MSRKYNKSTGRKYTNGSYDQRYGKRTSKQRSERNKARRLMKAKLTKQYGAKKAAQMMKGKDVAHKKSISSGGTNSASNLKLTSPKKNRGRKGEGGRKRKRR